MSMQVRSGRAMRAVLVAGAVLASSVGAQAETKVKPGFNLFSVEQDVQLGRQAAQQAERQFPLLRDRNAEAYVGNIVASLAQHAPGARYQYQARLVNAREINAFALPGGFLYVNRGTIEAASNEGQLAGVIAHEMAHVALRHGTHQASKAYAAQAGLGVLGGILGGGRGGGGASAQIMQAVGGLGLNAVFLKFSRDAETQADIVGAQMMAKAGYDPMDMVHFFEVLQRQQKGGGGAAQFFSDHPAPANRAERIRQEAQLIGAPSGIRRTAGNFDAVRQELRGMSTAPTARGDYRQTAARQTSNRSDDGYPPVRRADRSYPATTRDRGSYDPDSEDDGGYVRSRDQGGYDPDATDEDGYPRSRRGDGAYPARRGRSSTSRNGGFDAPSSRMRTYGQGNGFTIQYPENWGTYEENGGDSVVIAPEGGIVDSGEGQSIVYGVVLNQYDAGTSRTRRGRNDLGQATDNIVAQVTRDNAHLREQGRSRQEIEIDGAPAESVVLQGRSPVTGGDERVTLYTRALQDGRVMYALFIAPAQDYAELDPTFWKMINTLRVDGEDVARR